MKTGAPLDGHVSAWTTFWEVAFQTATSDTKRAARMGLKSVVMWLRAPRHQRDEICQQRPARHIIQDSQINLFNEDSAATAFCSTRRSRQGTSRAPCAGLFAAAALQFMTEGGGAT